jgi:hypothetical protein
MSCLRWSLSNSGVGRIFEETKGRPLYLIAKDKPKNEKKE